MKSDAIGKYEFFRWVLGRKDEGAKGPILDLRELSEFSSPLLAYTNWMIRPDFTTDQEQGRSPSEQGQGFTRREWNPAGGLPLPCQGIQF